MEYDHIFISHSTQDQHYAKGLVDLIELTGFKKITCSSHPVYAIPQDVNIYDYLRDKLNADKVWVIFVLSKEYYNSPACLNEMGATWVLSKHYTSILLPNFNFGDLKGAVDPRKLSFKLNDEIGLNDFKENLVKLLDLERPRDNVWESARDDVIAKVNKFAAQERKATPAKIEVETIVPISSTPITFNIMFRLTNNYEYPIHFQNVNLTLTDENQNTVHFERNINTILQHKENRLIEEKVILDTTFDPFTQVATNIEKYIAHRKYI